MATPTLMGQKQYDDWFFRWILHPPPKGIAYGCPLVTPVVKNRKDQHRPRPRKGPLVARIAFMSDAEYGILATPEDSPPRAKRSVVSQRHIGTTKAIKRREGETLKF